MSFSTLKSISSTGFRKKRNVPYPLVMSLTGRNVVTRFVGGTYTDQGVSFSSPNALPLPSFVVAMTSNVDYSKIGSYTMTYTVDDAQGYQKPQPVTRIVLVAERNVLAINAGGNQITDTADGTVYIQDVYYTGGQTAGTSSTNFVPTTIVSQIYASVRYGLGFKYSIPVLVGATYRVRIKLAETHFDATNQRKFQIKINETIIRSELDIFSEASGRYKPFDIVVPTITSFESQMLIYFIKGSKDLPSVSALVVELIESDI